MSSLDATKTNILSKIDLFDLIGQSVDLKRFGQLRKGLCPFHEENSPSFAVYPDHYYCFGCRENGDAISFVRKTKGLTFFEALEHLAKIAGIDIPELKQLSKQTSAQKNSERMFKLLQMSQEILIKNLFSKQGKNAWDYLSQRGFSDESIKLFGFGLAFDDSSAMVSILKKHGYTAREIEASSMGVLSEKNGKLYDFFRGRLTVPIYDFHGRLIAFGGRSLDGYPPKYKNSRESPLFSKSETLFGMERAKDFLRKGEPTIVVEGYFDALQLWQSGFNGAVACMGTALKASHLKLISRFSNQAVLLFDGDNAGHRASLATVKSALAVPDLEIKVAILPAKEDPDSFLRSRGAEALRSLIEKSAQLLDFAISQKVEESHGHNIPSILRDEIVPWLCQIDDRLQRSYLTNRISELTGITATEITNEIQQASRKNIPQRPAPSESLTNDRPVVDNRKLSPKEFEIIGHLFFAEQGSIDLSTIGNAIEQSFDFPPIWFKFYRELFEVLKAGNSPSQSIKPLDLEVLKIVEHLLGMREAFEVKDRQRQIEKIILHHKFEKNRASIAKLRIRLGGTSDEQEQSDIVGLIHTLNKDLILLENSIKNA